MNKNSQKLCMKDTHFVNPTGLSNVNNVSTARDIALLTQACLKNAVLRSIFKKKSYNCIASNDKMGYTRCVSDDVGKYTGRIPISISFKSESALVSKLALRPLLDRVYAQPIVLGRVKLLS